MTKKKNMLIADLREDAHTEPAIRTGSMRWLLKHPAGWKNNRPYRILQQEWRRDDGTCYWVELPSIDEHDAYPRIEETNSN